MEMVPIIDPPIFLRAYEKWMDACAGRIKLEPEILAKSREVSAALSGGRATDGQAILAAVALAESGGSQARFSTIIARMEAFADLLSHTEVQITWATRGWCQLSEETAGSVAPAQFLLTIAATCPLIAKKGHFDVSLFEQRALRISEARRQM